MTVPCIGAQVLTHSEISVKWRHGRSKARDKVNSWCRCLGLTDVGFSQQDFDHGYDGYGTDFACKHSGLSKYGDTAKIQRFLIIPMNELK